MNERLPSLKPQKVLQVLKRAGFFIHHTTGSHYVLKHSDKLAARVTVAYHTKDLKRHTLLSIIEQAGMTIEEFLKYL